MQVSVQNLPSLGMPVCRCMLQEQIPAGRGGLLRSMSRASSASASRAAVEAASDGEEAAAAVRAAAQSTYSLAGLACP
jgi:hypothetical protein